MSATKTMTDAEIVTAVRMRTHVLLPTGGTWQCGELDSDALEPFLDRQWQPIETAPKDGTSVLVAVPGWRQPEIARYSISERFDNGRLNYRSEGWRFSFITGISNKEPTPTHWMALPPMPDGIVVEQPFDDAINRGVETPSPMNPQRQCPV